MANIVLDALDRPLHVVKLRAGVEPFADQRLKSGSLFEPFGQLQACRCPIGRTASIHGRDLLLDRLHLSCGITDRPRGRGAGGRYLSHRPKCRAETRRQERAAVRGCRVVVDES